MARQSAAILWACVCFMNIAARRAKEKPEAVQAPKKRTLEATMNAESFHFVGSSTNWEIDDEPMPVNGYRLVLGRKAPDCGKKKKREEFQIVGDATWEKPICPETWARDGFVLLQPGESSPAAIGGGHGLNWAVEGALGTAFFIVYDHEAKSVCCIEAGQIDSAQKQKKWKKDSIVS